MRACCLRCVTLALPVAAAAAWLGIAGVVVADDANSDGATSVDANSDGGQSAAASAHDFFPLSLGDRWVYKKTTTHPGEQPTVGESFALVRGEYLFNGELWFHYEEDGICFWIHNRDDGQYESTVGYDEETAGLQIEHEFLLFKMPAAAGDSWPLLNDLLSEDAPGEVRCIAESKQVRTPAGKFDCMVFEIEETDSTATYYIARGMGIVANEWRLTETGETITLELKRFLPGKVRRRGAARTAAAPGEAVPADSSATE